MTAACAWRAPRRSRRPRSARGRGKAEGGAEGGAESVGRGGGKPIDTSEGACVWVRLCTDTHKYVGKLAHQCSSAWLLTAPELTCVPCHVSGAESTNGPAAVEESSES